MSNPILPRTSSKTLISQPSYGVSPSGFERLHIEMLPREVGRLLGYDPRVLVMRPKRRELLPHNVSPEIIKLQNSVQRSIDKNRVAQMVTYLVNAMESEAFADWGSIELVTSSKPDVSKLQTEHVAGLPSDADYFIADGQHRYCALMDFVTQYPQYADRFTQSVTISVLPEDKLERWAGQAFHDRNYYSVPVRAGKALSVDTRDPVNALAKDLAEHPTIKDAGGIAYERDTLLKNDPRFTTHSVLHRFVRGFILGRPGLDKGADTRGDISPQSQEELQEYIRALGLILPWKRDTENRDLYLTRTSAVLSALAVIGHDIFAANLTQDQKVSALSALAKIDWRRDNKNFIGVVGSEKDGVVMPNASRQAIDSTIKYLRDRLALKPA